jgi:hypothetical protein
MFKKYKSSLNFAFGVLVETCCIGRIPGPQLAGNKPSFVAYIIVSVFCSSEGWSTSDPNIWRSHRDIGPSLRGTNSLRYRGLVDKDHRRRIGHLHLEGLRVPVRILLRILVEWKEGVTALEAPLLEVMGDIPDSQEPRQHPQWTPFGRSLGKDPESGVNGIMPVRVVWLCMLESPVRICLSAGIVSLVLCCLLCPSLLIITGQAQVTPKTLSESFFRNQC